MWEHHKARWVAHQLTWTQLQTAREGHAPCDNDLHRLTARLFGVSALPALHPPTAVNEDRSLLSRLKAPEYRENRFIYGKAATHPDSCHLSPPHEHEVALDDQALCSADSSTQGGQI